MLTVSTGVGLGLMGVVCVCVSVHCVSRVDREVGQVGCYGVLTLESFLPARAEQCAGHTQRGESRGWWLGGWVWGCGGVGVRWGNLLPPSLKVPTTTS